MHASTAFPLLNASKAAYLAIMQVIPYQALQQELEIPTVRELEDFIITGGSRFAMHMPFPRWAIRDDQITSHLLLLSALHPSFGFRSEAVTGPLQSQAPSLANHDKLCGFVPHMSYHRVLLHQHHQGQAGPEAGMPSGVLSS